MNHELEVVSALASHTGTYVETESPSVDLSSDVCCDEEPSTVMHRNQRRTKNEGGSGQSDPKTCAVPTKHTLQ